MVSLSKSRYCRGIQCPKMLWLDKNIPDLFDQSMVVSRADLDTGKVVGVLAKGYFGSYVEVSFSQNKLIMVKETQRLIDAKVGVVAEASFVFEENFCSVDLLRVVEGGFEIVEVKSSTGSSSDGVDKVESIYLEDMAFQTYVLTHCGLDVSKVSLMQLNREYTRQGDLDLEKLFVLTDCTEQVFEMQQSMAKRIAEIKAVAMQKDEPVAVIGSRCDKPNECGYKNLCFRHLPAGNVFEIGWGMRSSKKDEAYNAGLVRFDEVLNGGVKLNEKQHRQVTSSIQNLPPHVNKKTIEEFLLDIRYPLYYLDFETYMQAIPQWDFVSPYSQILFQYSLHIQEKQCGDVVHKEFLGKEGVDPRRQIAEQLCTDIPMNVCVLTYNMSFEKKCIEKLAQLFPDLSEHLLSIHGNMIDLAKPFQSGAYYCKEMGGSYSIKKVLPALCPNDPELDYNSLNLIHKGDEAMKIYATLHEKPPQEITKIRKALLAYCKLDTLAMVKILDKLYTAVK